MCLAVPGKIISTDNNEPLLKMDRVSFGGLIKQVSLAYVPQAEIDDYVIVHAGFALSIIDERPTEATASKSCKARRWCEAPFADRRKTKAFSSPHVRARRDENEA